MVGQAAKAARKAIESLYVGVCDIIYQQKVKDPATMQTHFEDVTVAKAQPCRLSYKSIASTEQGSAAKVTQAVKLFMSPDIVVQAGARITVTQNGRTQEYKASGEPALYATHQEIMLELAGDYA